jgi:hypothetical protein
LTGDKPAGIQSSMTAPKGSRHNELTLKQSLFVEYLCDPQSKTYRRSVASYKAAGFKDGIGVAQACSRLLNNDKIVKYMNSYQAKTCIIKQKRQEISKQYALDCLQETYEKAKEKGDTTNQVACVRLMMQHNGMLIERVAVDIEDSRRIDTQFQTQVKRIASFMVHRGLLNPGDPALLQANSAPVSREMQPQDTVCADNIDNTIIDTTFDNDTQVVDNKEDTES